MISLYMDLNQLIKMSSLLYKKLDIFIFFCINIFLMKTSDYINVRINRFPKGYVFTYKDFIIEVDKKDAIIKALNRLVKSNKNSTFIEGEILQTRKYHVWLFEVSFRTDSQRST